MNEMVSKFSLAWDKFMPEMRLRHSGLTYSAYGPCSENKERIKKLKETRDSRYIYQNELDKLALSRIWLMEILKIYLEEQWLINYYVIKHLTLLKI